MNGQLNIYTIAYIIVSTNVSAINCQKRLHVYMSVRLHAALHKALYKALYKTLYKPLLKLYMRLY